MRIKKQILLVFLFYLLPYYLVYTQELTQSIQGKVIDRTTELPLAYASIYLKNTYPVLGTITDENGNFTLENIPINTYSLICEYNGYDLYIQENITLSSAKQKVVVIALDPKVTSLNEVVVLHKKDKQKAVNWLNKVSVQKLSMADVQKFAGGFNDPARLVSSYAGIASGISSNGISIRGNAPNSVVWRLNGVPIRNPSHFANLVGFGAGGITALSSYVLKDSDFLTGAFAAEYSNGISGVFDLQMRKGNPQKKEHRITAGLLGVDISSEGALSKNKKSSYLFNYRYSILSLLKGLLPEDAEKTKYQDLSFYLDFPIAKKASIGFWGLGLLDNSGTSIKENPIYLKDNKQTDNTQYMGVFGLKYKQWLGTKTKLQTTLAWSKDVTEIDTKIREDKTNIPFEFAQNNTAVYSFNTSISHRFSKKTRLKTGFNWIRQQYNIQRNDFTNTQSNPIALSKNGNANTLHGFGQILWQINPVLQVSAGISTQYFSVTKKQTIEPRASISWQINPVNSLHFGYGLHSKTENLAIYFIKDNAGEYINNNLDFSKAHHFVCTYKRALSKDLQLKIEPYYQGLFSIPITPTGSYSLINAEHHWFTNDKFIHNGTGKNYGIDFTLEKSNTNGLYYLLSSSLFRSRYTAADHIERSTKFDKGLISNVVIGKQWHSGKNKQHNWSINGKYTFQKGNRISPLDPQGSITQKKAVYQQDKAFSRQLNNQHILSFTTKYTKNRKKSSHIWTLQLLNALGTEEFHGYKYHIQNSTLEMDKEIIMIPSFSYSILF